MIRGSGRDGGHRRAADVTHKLRRPAEPVVYGCGDDAA